MFDFGVMYAIYAATLGGWPMWFGNLVAFTMWFLAVSMGLRVIAYTTASGSPRSRELREKLILGGRNMAHLYLPKWFDLITDLINLGMFVAAGWMGTAIGYSLRMMFSRIVRIHVEVEEAKKVERSELVVDQRGDITHEDM